MTKRLLLTLGIVFAATTSGTAEAGSVSSSYLRAVNTDALVCTVVNVSKGNRTVTIELVRNQTVLATSTPTLAPGDFTTVSIVDDFAYCRATGAPKRAMRLVHSVRQGGVAGSTISAVDGS